MLSTNRKNADNTAGVVFPKSRKNISAYFIEINTPSCVLAWLTLLDRSIKILPLFQKSIQKTKSLVLQNT